MKYISLMSLVAATLALLALPPDVHADDIFYNSILGCKKKFSEKGLVPLIKDVGKRWGLASEGWKVTDGHHPMSPKVRTIQFEHANIQEPGIQFISIPGMGFSPCDLQPKMKVPKRSSSEVWYAFNNCQQGFSWGYLTEYRLIDFLSRMAKNGKPLACDLKIADGKIKDHGYKTLTVVCDGNPQLIFANTETGCQVTEETFKAISQTKGE